jgi:hypothetical protein
MRHWAKHILPTGAVACLATTLLVAASCGVGTRDSGLGTRRGLPSPDTAAPSAGTTAATGAEIAAGTNLALASAVELCAGISRPGDAFTATVTGSVMGSRGAVIPVGSIVVGHVVESRDTLALGFDSVAIAGGPRMVTYPLSARVIGRLQTVSIPHPGPLGGMIDDSQRAHPPNTTYASTRVTCIPERGRLTIQLVADVPLEK